MSVNIGIKGLTITLPILHNYLNYFFLKLNFNRNFAEVIYFKKQYQNTGNVFLNSSWLLGSLVNQGAHLFSSETENIFVVIL